MKDVGDWVEGIIVLVVLVGSALSGLGKAIVTKINRRKEEERERREIGPLVQPLRPAPTMHRPVPPPARPMLSPTQRRSFEIKREVILQPVAELQAPSPPPRRHIELDVPEVVRPLVEMLMQSAGDEAPLRPVPAPPRRPRSSRPRQQTKRPPPVTTPQPPPDRDARMREFAQREAQQGQRIEQRLGRVETHVPAAAADRSDRQTLVEPLDRHSLRRAILLNEILGPPVALRGFSGPM